MKDFRQLTPVGLLLRADIDALEMTETGTLPYKSENGFAHMSRKSAFSRSLKF